jgi:hypothetical protein
VQRAKPTTCWTAVTPTVRQGQHDHMLIGRNEIGVQHMIKVFADELGIAMG